jgi:MFS family permease
MQGSAEDEKAAGARRLRLGRSILGRNPSFRWLWAARAISYSGDGIALIALVLYVQETEQSGLAVGLLVLAQTAPRLLGPLAGTVADRVDQRRLMVACDLGQASLYAIVAATLPQLWLLLPLVAGASGLATLFGPAGRSALPALVPRDDLLQANAWLGMAFNLQVSLAPLLGGTLAAALGPRGALAANAVTFLLSAGCLLRLPALPPEAGSARESRSFLADSAQGLAYVARHPYARAIVVALFLSVSFAGLDNVALVFLARDTLGAGSAGFGLLVSAYGLGMLLVALGLAAAGRRVAPMAVFLAGLMVNGLGTLLTGISPTLGLAVVAQALAGAGNQADVACGDTIIQSTVPRPMLGRVFGLVGTAAVAGSSVAAVAGGVLLEFLSPRAVFILAGAGVLLAFPLAVALAPRGPLQSVR